MTTKILAASAVVRDESGRFLLVQRAKDPEAGCWTVPGGKVEVGESLEQAAARETFEETGIVCEILDELWRLDLPGQGGVMFEIHDFLARPVGGKLTAGDDASEVGWFHAAEMSQLPLTADLLGYFERANLLSDL